MGYILVTTYEKIVVERLFAGKTHLTTALPPLVEAAEQTLALDEAKRQRTIVRLDVGGGSLAQVNGLLVRGYQDHHRPGRAGHAHTGLGGRLSEAELTSLVSFLRTWEPSAPAAAQPLPGGGQSGPPWLRNNTNN